LILAAGDDCFETLVAAVQAAVLAEDVVKLNEATTVQGQPVKIRVKDGKVFINDAQVVITDIQTSNGVIPVIDSMTLPPA
jgi:uncharacterized surface protein with fasciclin (FAS1) repeats